MIHGRKKEGTGFIVKDKRFSGDSEEVDKKEKIVVDKMEKDQETSDQSKKKPSNDFEYPPVNFTNFILSLSTSALFHFGDFADESGGKSEKNLPAAKQTIDVLDMLHEKTRGNLDEDENKLLQSVLYELKMRYVKEKA